MKERCPDHYRSIFGLHCWTLILEIHSGDIWRTNIRLLSLLNKLNLDSLLQKTFFQSLFAHFLWFLFIFYQIFLFFPGERFFFTGTRTLAITEYDIFLCFFNNKKMNGQKRIFSSWNWYRFQIETDTDTNIRIFKCEI